jgi:hypothetical protein
VPAADGAFRSLAQLLCAPPLPEALTVAEPVAPVPEPPAELAELAREVRLLRARLADAELLLAELHERLP